jgi:hypothetical protein
VGLLSAGIEGAGLLSTGVLFAEEYAGGPDAGAEAEEDSSGVEADEDWPAPPPAPPLPAHLPPVDSFTSWQSFWFSTGLV